MIIIRIIRGSEMIRNDPLMITEELLRYCYDFLCILGILGCLITVVMKYFLRKNIHQKQKSLARYQTHKSAGSKIIMYIFS